MPIPNTTVVLKFGSSVLRTAASLPVAVAEVYRHYREGYRIIAVVSAFEGVTDRLLTDAKGTGDAPDPGTLAVLLSTGESASAAQLALALQGAGIPARYVDPRSIELTAVGDPLNAKLSGVRVTGVNEFLSTTPVLVVPGFFAAAADGGLALLGRGGSDLTAAYLAAELQARCILLKDVDGLYEADPATSLKGLRRFTQASYATAEVCAGALVQPKAVGFARERGLTLDLARVGHSQRTQIGAGPSLFGPIPVHRRIRVALLGLGTVGDGVLHYLAQFPERFQVVAALVRTPEKHVTRGVTESLLVRALDDVFIREPEILVEALPGLQPAREYIDIALKIGIRVVTANKELLAADWDLLARRLVGPRRPIRYAAAVGGAVPMLETVERLALRHAILRLRGVVNGTCNFVLDALAKGVSFTQAVHLAQERGFAEANPVADLTGIDAARKIEILGRLAFGGTPVCQVVSGINDSTYRSVADTGGLKVALIAEAWRTDTGFTFKVAPSAVSTEGFIGGARGAENRLEITTLDGAVIRLKGQGAGRIPTATAVFADVLAHARVIDAEESAMLMGANDSTDVATV